MPYKQRVDPIVSQRLLGALSAWPELELVMLYGSIAKGSARQDSDIDVAVLAPSPLSPDARLAMAAALTRAVGRPAEVLDLSTAHGTILAEVLTDGLRLHMTSQAAYEGLLRRLVYEEADFMPLYRRLLRERRESFLNGKSGR